MTQAPTTSTTENTPQWSAAYREALAKRARWWMGQGAIVLPVIPVQLPADRWHKTNRKTGEPVRDKGGNLSPTFPGKAPSAWNRKTGEPFLIQRDAIAKGTRKPPTEEEVLRALEEPVTTGAAAEFGYPIGFCILTGPDLVVIDLTIARAGPTAVRQLADWGADVIHVEPPRRRTRAPGATVPTS